ncbi:unnamed protein product [Paramecium primaurelia]|uniref:Uncharacterized protein n=1 Tax=Paramecium primaurelia TaxID=5886 RepID=A0A8S1ME38_PARPR|nr:unnamed protein product [Paramecium primaurelia]
MQLLYCQTQSNIQKILDNYLNFYKPKKIRQNCHKIVNLLMIFKNNLNSFFQNETQIATIQTFKAVVQNINNLNKDNKIEIMFSLTQNNQINIYKYQERFKFKQSLSKKQKRNNYD